MTLKENGLRLLSTGVLAGDLVHIETVEASGDSTIDFTNVFSSDYDRYVIFVDNYVPSSDDELEARLSSDGGNTWDSGSSDYAHSAFQVVEDGSTATNGSSGNSTIGRVIILAGSDVANNDTSSTTVSISDPSDGNRATTVRTSGSSHYSGDTNPFRSQFGGGIRLAQSAVDSIQFFGSSSDISSGIFSVFGVDKK